MAKTQYTIEANVATKYRVNADISPPVDQEYISLKKAKRDCHDWIRDTVEEAIAGGETVLSAAASIRYYPSEQEIWARKGWIAVSEDDQFVAMYEQAFGQDLGEAEASE